MLFFSAFATYLVLLKCFNSIKEQMTLRTVLKVHFEKASPLCPVDVPAPLITLVVFQTNKPFSIGLNIESEIQSSFCV